MLTKIKTWLFGESYKFTAKVYLKSGAVLSVPCDDVKIRAENGNEISEINFEGALTSRAFYIRLVDVSAIQYFPWKRGD